MPSILGAHRDQAFGKIGDLRLARGILDHVVPLASTAAISAFSVAPTETVGKLIVPPGRPPWARSPSHSRPRSRSRHRAPPAPSDAGRSAGCRSRSRRAATPSPRPPARPAGRAPGSRRASCGRCRRARSVEAIVAARIVITRPKSSGLRAFDRGRDAELVEQVAETVDVGQPRQVAQRQRLVGQQRAGQQGQRGILGAGNRILPLRRLAAADDDPVHGGLLKRLTG